MSRTALAGTVRVVDQQQLDAPADGATMGEVVLRGNTTMMGYFKDAEATDDAFEGGWFHTGDVGVMHADGSIELRDWKKDVIISGGENVSTIEVEQAVISHPAVMEAAVVAIPNEKWEGVAKAFVTLKIGCSASAEDIIEHARGRIAHFKVCRSGRTIAGLMPSLTSVRSPESGRHSADPAGHDPDP